MSTMKLLAAVGLGVALAPAAAASASSGRGSAARPHVQAVAITILKGDRVSGAANIALAPGVPVRITVTNFTQQFHTFSSPGLGVNTLVLPARGGTATKTTFTFTPHAWGSFAWRCEICPSGIHGQRHSMGGVLYLIVDPSALP
jgi:hypothetical protein